MKKFIFTLVILVLTFLKLNAAQLKQDSQIILNNTDQKTISVKYFVDKISPDVSKKLLKKKLKAKIVLDDDAKKLIRVKGSNFLVPLGSKNGQFKFSKNIKFSIKKTAELNSPTNFNYNVVFPKKAANKLGLEAFEGSIIVSINGSTKLNGRMRIPNSSTLDSDVSKEASANTTLELVDSSTDEVLETFTTDENGEFELELPQGQPLDAELFIQANSGEDDEIRVPVVSDDLTLSPISEIVSREIAEENDSITADEAHGLLENIEDLDLDNLSFDDIPDCLDEISSYVGDTLDKASDFLGEPPEPEDPENNSSVVPPSLSDLVGLYHFGMFEHSIGALESGTQVFTRGNIEMGLANINPPVNAALNIVVLPEREYSAELSKEANSDYQIEVEDELKGGEAPIALMPELYTLTPFIMNNPAEVSAVTPQNSIDTTLPEPKQFFSFHDEFFIGTGRSLEKSEDATTSQLISQSANFGFDFLAKHDASETNSVHGHNQYRTLSHEIYFDDAGQIKYSCALETMTLTGSNFVSEGDSKFVIRTPSSPTTSSSMSGDEAVSSSGSISSSENQLSIIFDDLSPEYVDGAVVDGASLLTYIFADDNFDTQDPNIVTSSTRKFVLGFPAHENTVDLTTQTYRVMKINVSASNRIIVRSNLLGTLDITSNGGAIMSDETAYLSYRDDDASPAIIPSPAANQIQIFTINSGANGSITGTWNSRPLDGWVSENGEIILMRASYGSSLTIDTELAFFIAVALP